MIMIITITTILLIGLLSRFSTGTIWSRHNLLVVTCHVLLEISWLFKCPVAFMTNISFTRVTIIYSVS